MNKVFVIILALLYLAPVTFAQDSIQARIVLIGDAGKLHKDGHQPVVTGARQTIPFDNKTTVIYLGDNLYKTGLPDDAMPTYNIAKAPLDSQANIADGTNAKVYFIPGNHDWNNGEPHGWDAIRRQQYYIDLLGKNNVKFFPQDGCPGPVEIEITPDVVLVIVDSQWWIHPYDKPGIESDCPNKTQGEVLTQLNDILAKNSKKLVIFATHHPFRSYGIHGGYFKLKQHIFPFTDAIKKAYIPLPVIGSIYPITRSAFGISQDMKHPFYSSMVQDFENEIKGHPHVIYVAGHEHSLQMIQDSGYNYIVSGSGSKSTRVSKSKKSLYSSSQNGFVTLEISKNKNVTASFYTVDHYADSNKIKKEFTQNIMDFSKVPVLPEDTLRDVEPAIKDSVVISASDRYSHPSGFKNSFLGRNYRKEWGTQIKLKVFNIRKEKGGLKIASLGGGKQTKSLRLKDSKGKEWTLRTIDKDPEKALPPNLRGTLANDIVQDLISAGHPYAPLVVPGLARANGIITPVPQFFFVPDDPAFGYYRSMFANTVCLLEEREPTPDNTDTRSTAKVISKMLEDNNHRIDQAAVLKARLLDMLIGDWDRHFDQWRWGLRDTLDEKVYYPIPRDRDQAFFNSDGILAWYISKFHLRFLQGFKNGIPSINWFNWEQRDFDRFFMNALTENEWINIIDKFITSVPDNVINESVKKLPPEIFAISGQAIIDKLKSRRNILKKEAITYYKFISKEVRIPGSNEPEYFHIKKTGNGLQVLVYEIKRRSDTAELIYNRVFDRRYTEEIWLYGLNGRDEFKVDDNVISKIRLRMIGGKGNDTFNINGNVRNNIYDLSTEKNALVQSNNSKVKFSSNFLNNDYKIISYNYDSYKFPQMNIGYNVEDKLFVGIGFLTKTYSFRKVPFSTSQRLSTLYALSRNAYQLRYQGIFNSVLLNKDILVNAEFVNPTLNNFFGLGNETVRFNGNNPEFYRVRYKYLQTDLLLRKRFNDVLHISIGPSYYHYWNKFEDNKNRILGDPALIGSDSLSVYSGKHYVGGKIKVDINYINNELFPTRGVVWYSEFSSMRGVNKNSQNLTKITTDMQVYAALSEPNKLVATVRLGAGHIFSKNFEYFQALNLGANNFIRGFRKNRFSGSTLAYGSMELRVKLFKSQSYILPGDVGVLGFYDIGRVWQRGESSSKWHNSFGGGLYYAPFNLVLVSATYGISDEDQLFNFSLGTKFNLTF